MNDFVRADLKSCMLTYSFLTAGDLNSLSGLREIEATWIKSTFVKPSVEKVEQQLMSVVEIEVESFAESDDCCLLLKVDGDRINEMLLE